MLEELAHHILDVARNSLEAGATRVEIVVEEDPAGDLLRFSVVDNGSGIPPYVQRHLTNPFFTTKSGKKVGLGLPFLQAAVERCGGNLEIKSEVGRGTKVTATFPYYCWDRPPLGDMPRTIVSLLAGNGHLNLCYRHIFQGQSFKMDTAEIRSRLKGIPLDAPEVLLWLRQYLEENLDILFGGGDHEVARRAG
ncbi:Histidine kinase-, DNA gyrase B-, and HSP90-like ATPase [Desulfofundulus australicus DSM 11792]|uniref:histidine kinase n=1 Tax=Desulfofundulus australicus DSM 11792 TaxID=1121425 RepID=A0A1M4UD00_9FIRM|nr:ATP-binding protein [Desulfofundulus australicus]SHE54498.1 Histidine kinase-, DNA gyrase B-, and HSP90-like ATPase [Desulfofundulus australicus DSM 11792]